MSGRSLATVKRGQSYSPKQQKNPESMNTETTLNSRFANTLKLVASNDGIYVYKRQLNQHPTYFLMSGSQIIHIGTRKSVLDKFRGYRPAYISDRFHSA